MENEIFYLPVIKILKLFSDTIHFSHHIDNITEHFEKFSSPIGQLKKLKFYLIEWQVERLEGRKKIQTLRLWHPRRVG